MLEEWDQFSYCHDRFSSIHYVQMYSEMSSLNGFNRPFFNFGHSKKKLSVDRGSVNIILELTFI